MSDLRRLPSSSLTLEEALELIESYEALPDIGDINQQLSLRQIPCLNEVPTNASTKPKKRVRNPMNDVRRRQRRKAERIQLKEQVQTYQILLKDLKRRKREVKSTGSVHSGSKTDGLTQTLVDEDEKLREAEDVNRRLKLLLMERLQVSGTIGDLMAKEKEILERSINSTTTLSRPLRYNPLQPSFTDYDFTSVGLKKTLQQVFDATDFVLAQFSTDAADSVETISRVKPQNQSCGPSIEVLTTTPLACEFKTARNSVWDVIMDKEQLNEPLAMNLKTHEPSRHSVELRFSMDFDDPHGTPIMLDGATLVEKHEEDNRTILAWTSLVVHQTQSLRFRSYGWVVATRSPTNPHAATTMRTCYRISAEHPSANISTSQDCRVAARYSILKTMGQRVKSRLKGAQKQLFQHTGVPNEEYVLLA